MTQKIELAQYRISQIPPSALNSTPEDIAEHIGELQARRNSLAMRKDELSNTVSRLQEGWDKFRRDILTTARAAVIGREYEIFETARGKAYQDALVARIDDLGVAIKHTHGSARIGFNDLSVEEQAFFGLDSELASAALVEERRYLATYERQIDREMQIIVEKQKEARSPG